MIRYKRAAPLLVYKSLPTSDLTSASTTRAILSFGDTVMRFKKREVLGVLLSTGLNLLDNLRERLPDNLENIKDSARETYETASGRLGRATDVLRGREDSRILSNVGALVIGVGVGVGVGLLIAPASGEETRADIAKKVSDFGKKVPKREHKPHDATGTYGG
jgi:YtxH-like protein